LGYFQLPLGDIDANLWRTIETDLQKKHFFVNTKEMFLHGYYKKKMDPSSVSINSKLPACAKHIV